MLELLARGVLDHVKLVWNHLSLRTTHQRVERRQRRLNSERYNVARDVTYFCEYGRYFLIGYYVSELENFLLLAGRATGLK